MDKNVLYKTLYNKFNVAYKNEKHKCVMPPHTHNAIEIYLSLSDLSNVFIGSASTSIKKNTLLIFPPYCIHSLATETENIYERYIMTIDLAWMEHLISAISSDEYGYLRFSDKPVILELEQDNVNKMIELLKNTIASKHTFGAISAFFNALEFIDELVSAEKNIERSSNKISETQKTVNAMLEYIDMHLFENLKINDIAKAFFISPSYASKIFKRYTFTPINNYITLQRINAARKMLKDGNSITRTQLATGYASYEHFFRTFKKVTGMTPREYREYQQFQNNSSEAKNRIYR